MTLHIGQITTEVELTGAADPVPAPGAGAGAAAGPSWAGRDAHRVLAGALDRDRDRTGPEDRDA